MDPRPSVTSRVTPRQKCGKYARLIAGVITDIDRPGDQVIVLWSAGAYARRPNDEHEKLQQFKRCHRKAECEHVLIRPNRVFIRKGLYRGDPDMEPRKVFIVDAPLRSDQLPDFQGTPARSEISSRVLR